MSNNIIKIPIGDKVAVMNFSNWDLDDIDIDDLMKIDYSNLTGELLTISVIVNKVGLLRAQAEEAMNVAKMQLNITSAQIQSEKRSALTVRTGDKLKGPTKDEVENAMYLDKRYKASNLAYINAQKGFAYMDALYVATRDKSRKVENLFNRLVVPEDEEMNLVEKTVNGIKIKIHKKLIK